MTHPGPVDVTIPFNVVVVMKAVGTLEDDELDEIDVVEIGGKALAVVFRTSLRLQTSYPSPSISSSRVTWCCIGLRRLGRNAKNHLLSCQCLRE